MSIHIKLDGYKELDELLSGMGDHINQKSVVRSALRKAGRPLILSARKKIANYSKTVANSITVNYQNREGDTIGIGPKKKGKWVETEPGIYDGSNVKDPWYAHFIEFGTSGTGRFKKAGRKRYRADMPARPFMRPAWAETQAQVITDFGKTMAEVLQKYIERKRKNVT